jgi:hypothetical protein
MMQPYDQTNLSNSSQYSSYKFPSQNNTRDISSILEGSEKQFLSYLVDMFTILNKDKIDLKKFNDVVDALIYLKKEQEADYYTYLVRPEKSKGCKIPSQIPIPSASFQLRQSINVSTNALGNLAIAFVPFHLGATPSTTGTFYVNNDATLNGTSSNNFFTSRDIGQVIPGVYSSYRLVSGSIIAKYTGRLDMVQGVIGGGILFDNAIAGVAYGAVNANLAKYGDFNIVQDAYFQQENHLINGIREIYFPLDASSEQYQTINITKQGFMQFIYVSGGPPSSNILKVDIFLNFECLPDASFLNYIPTSSITTPFQNKDEMIRKAQKEPITKEAVLAPGEKIVEKSTFDKVVDTIGVVIPGIADIAKVVGRFLE